MTIRKTITIKANDEEFLIKELTVKEIIGFLDQKQPEETGTDDANEETGTDDANEVTGLLEQVDEVMTIAIPGLKADMLVTWAPSEIEKLYAGFREVNHTFFTMAQRLGLNNLWKEVEQAMAKDFSSLFVASLKAVI